MYDQLMRLTFGRLIHNYMEEFTDAFTDSHSLLGDTTDKKVQMAWQLFVSLEYQVQVADRKVQAVFGLNAFLVAALSLQSQEPLREIVQGAFSFSLAMDLLLKAAFLACVCIATWSALKALSPRIKMPEKGSRARRSSLFFFGDIQRKESSEFVSAFLGLSNTEAAEQILRQSQVVSHILSTKYSFLRKSTIFLLSALAIWVLIKINEFFA